MTEGEWAGLRQRRAVVDYLTTPAGMQRWGWQKKGKHKGVYSEEKGKERRGCWKCNKPTSATSVKATLLNVSSYFRLTGMCRSSNDDGAGQCGKAAAFTPLSAALPPR